MGLYVPSECHQDWKTKFQCVTSGRFLKARFKCPLAHFEHNMRAACFDMMNKISLLTMCWRGTNRSRYASNVHLVLSFHLHVCLFVQPNYANKGEEDSLLQIMTLKGVYCSRQTVLALRRQGWPPTLIVDWFYERSTVLVHRTTWKDMVMMLILMLSGRTCRNSVPILIAITRQFGVHLCTINFHNPVLPHSIHQSTAVNRR